jgi:group I intron endonuclease
MPFTLYLHVNTANGKKYVGQTKHSMEQRWKQHVLLSRSPSGKRTSALSRAIARHGADSFVHEALEVVDTQELANEAEARLIMAHGSAAPHGYNLTFGGTAARMTDETRRRMSDAKKGKPHTAEHNAKVSAALMGRKIVFSEEHVENMRKAIRPPISAETRAKIAAAIRGKFVGRKLTPESVAKRTETRRANRLRAVPT